MKIKNLKSIIILALFTDLLSCNTSKSDNKELLGLALRAIRLANQENIYLQGVVKGPGSVRNASVQIFPTPDDGKCISDDGKVNGKPVASTTSDDQGRYAVSYKKTGKPLCVAVIPSDGSQIEVFSPASKTSSPKPWTGGNTLMAVINEPSNKSFFGLGSNNKTVNVTPFTRMAARRYSALTSINGGVRLKKKVFMRVNNSLVGIRGKDGSTKIEFATNSSLSLIDKATEDVENTFFPKRNKASFELESASTDDPGYALKLGALAITADKIGGGVANGSSTSDDFEKVINFMEEDFSDGRFDGKKIDPETNKVAVLSSEDLGGVVTNSTEADNFLSGTFTTNMTEYDSYDDEYSSGTDDSFFCDADSHDPACSFSFIPGSPPEIWIFGPDGEMVDLSGTSDLGNVGFGTGGTKKTAEFTIVNTGGSDLVLSLPFSFSTPEFVITSQPAETVAPGDATFFQVEFTPSSATLFTTNSTVTSNDELYSPYPFSVTGTGVNLGTGLVLYWPFTGDSTDSSASGFDGLGSATLTFDLFGDPDSAFNFDGASDYLGYGPGVLSGGAGSFSAWVAPGDTLNTNPILSQGNTNFEISFDSDNLVFYVMASSPVTLAIPIDPDLFLNQWNLVTGVYNGSNMTLYVNGVSVGSIGQVGNITNGANFTVGTNAGGGYFLGDIDDVRVYNTALTTAQIQALFNQD